MMLHWIRKSKQTKMLWQLIQMEEVIWKVGYLMENDSYCSHLCKASRIKTNFLAKHLASWFPVEVNMLILSVSSQYNMLYHTTTIVQRWNDQCSFHFQDEEDMFWRVSPSVLKGVVVELLFAPNANAKLFLGRAHTLLKTQNAIQ